MTPDPAPAAGPRRAVQLLWTVPFAAVVTWVQTAWIADAWNDSVDVPSVVLSVLPIPIAWFVLVAPPRWTSNLFLRFGLATALAVVATVVALGIGTNGFVPPQPAGSEG